MIVPCDSENRRKLSTEPRRIALFGSTGSIGCSTLEIVDRFPGLFQITVLAGGSNVKRLAQQVLRYRPSVVGIADESSIPELRELCRGVPDLRIVSGTREIAALAAEPGHDLVVAAIVGFAGLPSVLAALGAGKTVALANKESLVSAGELAAELVAAHGSRILPVDSEHSALFQVLQGERASDVEELVLTASGGPFLKTPYTEFSGITPERALKHPNWAMGAKITIDSATMVNKAFEVVEAYWLYRVPIEAISVLVHPQSIVHSLVRFRDGSTVAQMGIPDMKVPIAYALHYPHGRLSGIAPHCDLAQTGSLEFLALDEEKFRAPRLIRECVRSGNAASAVFTIANDVAVERFLKGMLRFDMIVALIEEAVCQFGAASPRSLDDLLELRNEVIAWAIGRQMPA